MDAVINGISEGDLVIVIHNPDSDGEYNTEMYLGTEANINGVELYGDKGGLTQSEVIAKAISWTKQTLFCDDVDPGTNQG